MNNPNHESYLTNPSIEDWINYNQPVFDYLKGNTGAPGVDFSPLVDVDKYVKNNDELLELAYQVIKKVGPLGYLELRLIYSDMGNSWHIVLRPIKDKMHY